MDKPTGLTDVQLSFVSVKSDVVVFRTRCAHFPEHAVYIGKQIAEITKEHGLSKAVLIGGCTDRTVASEELLVQLVNESGVELTRLDVESRQEWRIKEHLAEKFAIEPQSWSDAISLQVTLPHLYEQAKRLEDIKEKIKKESELMEEYPIAQSVQAIEWHPTNIENSKVLNRGFCDLFGLTDLVSSTNAVALFSDTNPMEGVLVTKSMQLKFNLPSSFSEYDNLKAIQNGDYEQGNCGSLRIQLKGSQVEISMYLLGGKWIVNSHKLDKSDPKMRYIPMWQRIRIS